MVALATLPTATLAQQPTAFFNGCSSILRAGTYKVFYDRSDPSPYAGFESAVCGLPSNNLNELVLPLGASEQTKFSTAAEVLVPLWAESGTDFNSPGFSSSNAYKVVRDFHTAICKVGGRLDVSKLIGLWLPMKSMWLHAHARVVQVCYAFHGI